MTTEFYVADRIIIPRVLVRSSQFPGAMEFADVEVEYDECIVQQITCEDGFNKF